MKNVFFKKGLYICLLAMTALCATTFTACTQEESDKLGDAAVSQRYMVAFAANGENYAYANFSKDKVRIFKPIKLTGEQKIFANGKNMQYNELNSYHQVEYSYSSQLEKNINEVKFSFVRNKTTTLENTIKKDNGAFIALPAELTTIEKGKPVVWKGAARGEKENIEVSLELNEKSKSYVMVAGKITEDGKGFVFNELPTEKGKYKLTLRRIIQQPTLQNDRTAKGEMVVSYFDTKDIQLK